MRSSPGASRRRVSSREEKPLRALIDELLDAVADAGEMEVVDALAAQLPSRITADLLGFPQDRWRDLKSWSERMMRIDSIPRDASGEVMQGVMAAITEFQAYLNEAVPRFREEPERLVHLGVGQRRRSSGCPMDDHTIMNETGLFISGGAETTRTAIARGLRVFCDHQDQWERLARGSVARATARSRRSCAGCRHSTRCSARRSPTTTSATRP